MLPFYQVDAFTDRAFSGNPAAVVVLDDNRSNEWLQHVAADMNLSETAFVTPRGDETYDLRWFTPIAEVDLCGHATLAASHVLWDAGMLGREDRIVFETASGRLTTWSEEGFIWMDFPAEEVVAMDEDLGIAAALGRKPAYVGSNRLDVLVEMEDESAVRSLEPDMHALVQLGTRGFIVTARASGGAYDFVSRYFAPRFGIPEDPVTGSAHCCLGPYWSRRLGRHDLVGYQASARGGAVRVVVRGNRVLLSGKAVTVVRGELLV